MHSFLVLLGTAGGLVVDPLFAVLPLLRLLTPPPPGHQ